MLFDGVNNTMLFSIISLVYMIFFGFSFMAKKKIKTIELQIFNWLIITNIIGLVVECLIVFFMMTNNPYLNVILKLFNVCIFTYVYFIGLYSYLIIKKKDEINKKSKPYIYYLLFYILVIILLLVLPIYLNDVEFMQYSYGPSVQFLFVSIGILLIGISIMLGKNIKRIKKRKFTPIFVLIFLLGINAIVQYIWPNVLLANSIISLVTFLMYFTIENPDLQLLREFHKAREYANNLNTEKSEFLFNMAGEIKTPISVINRISKEVLMQDDINVIKSKVNDIKYSSNNLLELVNKVLDINSLEKRKVSVRESKYNTTNLFKGIESQTELKLNNDLVKFRTNYDKSIPNELYGDSVRIRQIVNTLLENAIKYTKEGFIELSVNSIVKHDICRLVITVEDSGVGMTQDVVEHLFDKELEKIEEIDNPKMDLGLVKTLLDLIGGTIIVNSELNHGTKFTIVLDQKVVNHKKNKTIEAVEKYEEMYLNNKKVMCVINDDTLSKKINTLFKKYQLDIEIVKLGQSCLEKVRAGEKFDLIIMEEHLEKLSSENTLAKLKSIQGFKTPVILLTDIKDINEKEEYLKLGFTEIVTLPLKKEQVEEIVNNYVND